jgi:hypothetical protein
MQSTAIFLSILDDLDYLNVTANKKERRSALFYSCRRESTIFYKIICLRARVLSLLSQQSS